MKSTEPQRHQCRCGFFIRQKGYDSLWAHSDTGMLRADEIVVYSEKAVDIRYLVEVTV